MYISFLIVGIILTELLNKNKQNKNKYKTQIENENNLQKNITR